MAIDYLLLFMVLLGSQTFKLTLFSDEEDEEEENIAAVGSSATGYIG